jgi:apolipoprotein N-acyltransferase
MKRMSDVRNAVADSQFWPRTTIGLALAISSAALLTLAFPPYNLGLLIWVGFIPMLLAQYRVLPPRLSSLGSAVAIGGWLGWLSLAGLVAFAIAMTVPVRRIGKA